MHGVRFAIGLALALGCAACATQRVNIYPGPERPSSEVATLAGSAHRLVLVFYNRTTEIRILAVDGQQVMGSVDEIALLPGHHVVQAAYGTFRSILWALAWVRPPLPPQTIEFVAEPGHHYRVDGQILEAPGRREFNPWIENVDTGAVVGGSRDPQSQVPAAGPR